ncbi:MAG TPA: TonB-dependent receptor [Longimicrobiales bacterium]|nr:TonB-dependent receptor [Longimicrobiales bacterium]
MLDPVRTSAPRAFRALLLLGLLAGPAYAQQTTGKVDGRVVDAASGQPLVGAQVSIVGSTLGNITDRNGYFFVNNVPAGLHSVQAQYIGYRPVTVANQRVLAGQTTTLTFQLPQEAVALEAITVQGESNPLVPRDQTSSKAVTTGDVVDAIPVENVRAVVALQPGVVETEDFRGQVIRGGRPGEASVYLDGILVRNFNEGNQGRTTLQNNAVEEVDVLLGGFGAEYGQAQSGVINLVSRGGSLRPTGALTFETDEVTLGKSYGYNRLEASVSAPLIGEKLGFTLAGTAIGQKDSRPVFSPSEIGELKLVDPTTGRLLASIPAGVNRFFRETGQRDAFVNGADTVSLIHYDEITDRVGDKQPYDNADQYNLNLTFRGSPTKTTRFSVGGTVLRNQQRLWGTFGPLFFSRPQSIPGRRTKSFLYRAGLEQILFQGADRGATLRLNIGYGQDETAQSILGETLADTAAVRDDKMYPLFGNFLGFTFKDFKFPFENRYTLAKYLERYRQMQEDPSLSYLVPFETLINPATGEPFTESEATNLFQNRTSPDNPFGISDISTGYTSFAYRKEKTLSFRGDLDWQANRYNRVGLGAELYRKDIDNLGSSSLFANAQTSMSLWNSSFQNAYTAKPTIGGFYAKDRLDLGEIVIELGARLDMFSSDVSYPTIPGFVLPVRDAQTGQTIEPQFEKQKTQWLLSPRLGVAFPVTDNTQFRLSYGHFTQVPALNFLFGGITQDLNKTNPNAIFGRPIKFGRTIGYEFGITHSFDPMTVLDVSGYAREKQGDVAFRTGAIDIPGRGQTTVRFLTNADFGYTRGLDLRLNRRLSNALGLQLNYSYLTAQSTGSDPAEYLSTIGRQTDPVTGEPVPAPQATFATGFDQRHKISGSGVLTTPKTIAEGNALLNTLLKDINATLAFQANSGLPYTKSRTPGATISILGPDPVYTEPVNSSRLPWTYDLSGRLGRQISLRGNNLLFYIDGRNILNTKNVIDAFNLTGSPLNPGTQFLAANTLDASRVPGHDIVLGSVHPANAAELTQKALMARREQLFGNGDGVFTVQEQQVSSVYSFLATGWASSGAAAVGEFTGFFYGQPRQLRLGVEWRF